MDNAAKRSSRLWGEHGLAFLIETGAGRVLFDTGQSGNVLLHNLKALEVVPQTIDALAISHAHYDHTGGLPRLLKHTRPDLPLYANPGLHRERFSRGEGRIRSIGLPLTRERLASQVTPHLSTDPQEILSEVWTTGEITVRSAPMGGSAHHLVRDGKGWAPDPYQDDMSMVIEVASGLVLLCGCCHAGLLNTLAQIQRTSDRPVVAIVGGTHLASATPDHLQYVGRVLGEMESVRHIYLNHCSGEEAFLSLRLKLGSDVVHVCPAGTRLDLERLS